jgi:hypothetical protein
MTRYHFARVAELLKARAIERTRPGEPEPEVFVSLEFEHRETLEGCRLVNVDLDHDLVEVEITATRAAPHRAWFAISTIFAAHEAG